MRSIFLAAFLFVAPFPLAAAQPAPGVTATFLHLWLPELGPYEPIGAFETNLARAVSEIRRGRFTTAEKPLAAAASTAASPRDRLLLLLAQQQLERRRYDLVTGGRLGDGETALYDLESRETALLDQAFAIAEPWKGNERDDAVAAVKFAWMLQLALDQIPAEHRATNTRDMLEEHRAALRKQLDEIVDLYVEHQSAATEAGVISATDSALLQRLLQAERARGRGDSAEAVKQLQAGLAAAPAAARKYWSLRLGDALVAPASSPLLLGIDAVAADGLLSVIEEKEMPPLFAPVAPASLDAAAAAYDAAASAAGDDRPFLAAVQLRRAYLQLARRDVMKALDGFVAVQTVSEEEDVVTWCAGASLAIMASNRELFAAVINEALLEQNGGFVAALTLVARTWAAKFRFLNEKPEEAIDLLEITSDALVPHGRRAAVEPLLDLVELYEEVDRYTGHIIAARQAERIQSEHLCRLRAVPRESDPEKAGAPDAEEDLLTTIIGKLASGLRAKALLEGDAQSAALADLLSAERARRAYVSSVSSDIPIVESQQAALMQPSIERIAVEAAALTGKPCPEIAPKIASIRSRALEEGFVSFAWQFDINNVACAPENLARDVEEIRKRDFTSEIETLLAKASEGGIAGMVAGATVHAALKEAFTALHVLAAGAPLLEYGEGLRKMGDLVQRHSVLAPFEREVLREYALFYSMAGEPDGVVRVVGDFVSHATWDGESADDKVKLLRLWLHAEAELCADPKTCQPRRALLVRERLGFESRRWQWLQSGASTTERSSAELAALETRLAADPAATSSDYARLAALRKEKSSDSWMNREEPPTPESIDGALAAVPSNATVLIYSTAASTGMLWRHRRGKLDLMPLSWPSGEIEESARELLRQLEAPLAGTWEKTAADLFDVLVRPAGKLVQGERLVIVASGDVGRIPFEILGERGAKRLYELHPIVYTDHLGTPRKQDAPGKTIAAVVGVNARGLAAAETEARDVARILSVTAIVGADATRTAVTAAIERASWIHLATHAARVSGNPYDSYLSLAGGERLRAWDLFRHAPAAELIVLSACDGRSDARVLLDSGAVVETETSLMSFAFAGGARFVLASIWRANDAATSELMTAFYEALHSGADPSAALQQARQHVTADGEIHPYYFANFVLTARDLAAVGGH